jgi:hypothetical protein
MKVELVCSLNEVSMSELGDRKEKKVILAMTMRGQTIHHGPSRSVKYLSVIACITAGGESLTPLVMTLQISDSIRKRLVGRGVCLGSILCCGNDRNGMSAVNLFLEHIGTIFIPYLNELRDSEEFEAC